MAEIKASGPRFVINAENTYIIGDADESFVGTFQLHLLASEDFDGSVSVVCRSRQTIAADDNVPFVAWNYLATYVNGAIGDQTYVDTAITDTSVILVPASGCRIALDCTDYNAGTLTVYTTPLAGAAA